MEEMKLQPQSHPTATGEDDFEFDFSGQLLHRPTLSAADELFDGGVIRPLHLQFQRPSASLFYTSPKSLTSKLDPFNVALKSTRRSDFPRPGRAKDPDPRPGRRKAISRSLSPLRVSEFASLQRQQAQKRSNSNSGSSTSSASSSSSTAGYRKWRLKDLLLFRGASEGRATTKRCSVYSALLCSFDDGVGAEELHYAENRAVSEEAKKKKTTTSLLSYKYGVMVMGCLGLSPSKSSSSSSTGYRRLSPEIGESSR